jgi:hypothetical protein
VVLAVAHVCRTAPYAEVALDPWASKGKWCWMIDRVIPLPRHIPYRGNLGLMKFPPALMAVLAMQVRGLAASASSWARAEAAAQREAQGREDKAKCRREESSQKRKRSREHSDSVAAAAAAATAAATTAAAAAAGSWSRAALYGQQQARSGHSCGGMLERSPAFGSWSLSPELNPALMGGCDGQRQLMQAAGLDMEELDLNVDLGLDGGKGGAGMPPWFQENAGGGICSPVSLAEGGTTGTTVADDGRNCLCREVWDEDDPKKMVECDGCAVWYHAECTGCSWLPGGRCVDKDDEDQEMLLCDPGAERIWDTSSTDPFLCQSCGGADALHRKLKHPPSRSTPGRGVIKLRARTRLRYHIHLLQQAQEQAQEPEPEQEQEQEQKERGRAQRKQDVQQHTPPLSPAAARRSAPSPDPSTVVPLTILKLEQGQEQKEPAKQMTKPKSSVQAPSARDSGGRGGAGAPVGVVAVSRNGKRAIKRPRADDFEY